MLKTVITLFSLLFSTSSLALTLPQLQQQLSQTETLRGEFVQIRQFNGLTRPLQSGGKLILSKQYGLFWQQESPFKLILVLNQQRLLQIIAGQQHIITAEDNPQLFQFSRLLHSLLNARQTELEQHFSLDFSASDNGQWVLLLTPKTSPLNKIFQHIRLTGEQFIEQITIQDQQGDNTTIDFNNLTRFPTELTSDEKDYFLL